MLRYIARRFLVAIPTVVLISIVSFFVIQLPPGDFLTSYAATLKAQGDRSESRQALELMRERYGLNQPIYVQYLKWVRGMLQGDFGQSLEWQVPVATLIWERMGLTLALSLGTLLFTWSLAIPIGVYSATHQYSIADYIITIFGFIGMGVPSFLLAIILMWFAFNYLGQNVGGLFSEPYIKAPWSWGKFVDLLKHLWIPVVILGISGNASLIRIMRAQLLDELHKPYVTTARAKGLSERRLIWKYPIRVALNPFISTVGWALPGLISGSTIISVVLNLQTTGPLLLRALNSQDMYLAGSFLLLLSVLTVIGTLVSDILLAALDPRIRLE